MQAGEAGPGARGAGAPGAAAAGVVPVPQGAGGGPQGAGGHGEPQGAGGGHQGQDAVHQGQDAVHQGAPAGANNGVVPVPQGAGGGPQGAGGHGELQGAGGGHQGHDAVHQGAPAGGNNVAQQQLPPPPEGLVLTNVLYKNFYPTNHTTRTLPDYHVLVTHGHFFGMKSEEVLALARAMNLRRNQLPAYEMPPLEEGTKNVSWAISGTDTCKVCSHCLHCDAASPSCTLSTRPSVKTCADHAIWQPAHSLCAECHDVGQMVPMV